MDRGCPIKPLKPVGAAGREIGDPAAGERGCGGVVHRERITQIPFTVQSYCHTVIADIQMSDVPGVIVGGAENVLIGGRRRSG